MEPASSWPPIKERTLHSLKITPHHRWGQRKGSTPLTNTSTISRTTDPIPRTYPQTRKRVRDYLIRATDVPRDSWIPICPLPHIPHSCSNMETKQSRLDLPRYPAARAGSPQTEPRFIPADMSAMLSYWEHETGVNIDSAVPPGGARKYGAPLRSTTVVRTTKSLLLR